MPKRWSEVFLVVVMEMEFAIILSGDLTSLARGWMTRAEFLGRLRIHKEMMQNNHRMSAANCARVDDSPVSRSWTRGPDDRPSARS